MLAYVPNGVGSAGGEWALRAHYHGRVCRSPGGTADRGELIFHVPKFQGFWIFCESGPELRKCHRSFNTGVNMKLRSSLERYASICSQSKRPPGAAAACNQRITSEPMEMVWFFGFGYTLEPKHNIGTNENVLVFWFWLHPGTKA